MQMPVVFEPVGDSEGQCGSQLEVTESAPAGACGPYQAPVEQPWPRSRRSAKWVLKITQRAMVKRRNYG